MRNGARARLMPVALFLALVFVYNANGREIGAVDTQPQKFTARELALIGTMRLSRVVEEAPALGERVAFARDLRGHYRSAYPILPGLLGGIPASVLHWTGAVDMRAPLAPFLIAALTASLMIAGAGAFVYPNERWNTQPRDVDRNHERLWTIRDSQIIRTLRADPSPQNFQVFSRDAIRQPSEDRPDR